MTDKDYEKRAKQYDNLEKVQNVREHLRSIDTDVESDSVEQRLTEADIRLEEVHDEMEDRETTE